MELIEAKLQALTARFLARSPSPLLARAMAYTLLLPGKRLRPQLCLASARALDIAPERVVAPAAALELFHCFSLIHDDLPCMDNDDFRRGKPANHRVHGEAMALLAGDALVSECAQVFFEAEGFAPDALARALRFFLHCAGSEGVIGGQALELELERALAKPRLEELLRVHALKTGALFRAAVLTPALLHGETLESANAQRLDAFARAFGIAFQIADDLEDHDPSIKSVLAHLNESEARKLAREPLEAALEGLAEPLRPFGQKLLERLA